MPTIAALLNVPLTWTPEGRAAGTGVEPLRIKTIRHGGARLETTVEAAVLAQKRDARGRPQGRAVWRAAGLARRGGRAAAI